MKRKAIVFLVFLFLVTLPVKVVFAVNNTEREDLLRQIAVLIQQIAALEQQLDERRGTVFTSRILPADVPIEKIYRVYGQGHIVAVADSKQKQMINRFLQLSPDALDHTYKEFVFFTDDTIELDAFVETLEHTNSWRIGFNTVLFDYPIKDEATTELLIHEIGHIVATREVNDKTLQAAFEANFLSDTGARQSFVSEYARENEREDFAESFLFFIREDAYSGIAAEKVNFFRRYPELIQYRSEIRRNS